MSRFLSFLLLAASLQATAAPGLPHVVDNPRQAPHQTLVRYEDVWRAGADSDEEFILGVIGGAVCDDLGNIYLLDTQQQQVFKFGADGSYKGVVVRRGSGPGEIENVYVLCAPGRGRLGCLQAFPPRLVLVDTMGTPLPGVTFSRDRDDANGPGIFYLYSLEIGSDHMVGQGAVMLGDGQDQDNLNFISSFASDGQEKVRYAQWRSGNDFTRAITVDEEALYQPHSYWSLDRKGRLYRLTSREEYEIEVLDPAGNTRLLIHRDREIHRRSKDDKEHAKKLFSFASNSTLPDISYHMADTDPAIASLQVLGNELWVTSPQQKRDLPEGVASKASVFDLEGHLLEERSLAFPMDPDRDLVLPLSDGRLVLVLNHHSALLASRTGMDIQRGDEKEGPGVEDEGGDLEVLLLKPLAPVVTAP